MSDKVPNPERHHGEELKEKGNHYFKGMIHWRESLVVHLVLIATLFATRRGPLPASHRHVYTSDTV